MKKMEIENKLLLTPKDVRPSFKGWVVKGVLNPGAIRLPDKKIALFVRVAEAAEKRDGGIMKCPVMIPKKEFRTAGKNKGKRTVNGREVYFRYEPCRLPTISHVKKVIVDKEGFEIEKIEEKPTLTGRPDDGEYGIEDPRIVKIGKRYVMTYVSVGLDEGVCTSITHSENLQKWKRQGITFRQQNKDVFLFPEKIRGRYTVLHRPEGTFEFSKPHIWVSYSKELIYWGDDKVVLKGRQKGWDGDRIGGGAPPIKTNAGWLEIYHGVKCVKSGKKERKIYCAGAALLDLKNPEKVIARSPENEPLFSPEEEYEKKGFISDVVFPSGAVRTLDGKSLLIYSGGADSVTTVKKIKIRDALNHMEKVGVS